MTLKKFKGIKVGIGVWDLHHPQHVIPLWENILKALHDIKVDYFIFGGDNMDCRSVSHWLKDKSKKKSLEGLRLRDEYKAFEADILRPLNRILKQRSKRIFLEGNHELWISDAIEKDPQGGVGFWEIENNLPINKWKIVEYGEHIKIGKAYFIHGNYTNEYHSKKTVLTYEKNVFYGHCHTIQVYSKITPVGNESHMGVSVPCACHMNPEFMKNKPNAWVNGFLIFYILPNGCFDYQIINSNNKGQFILHGKRYD